MFNAFRLFIQLSALTAIPSSKPYLIPSLPSTLYPTPCLHGGESIYNAAFEGNVAEIMRLADAGEDVNAHCFRKTPVFVAASRGKAPAISTLKELRANIDTPDEDGNTPIHIAAKNGEVAAIEALIEAGANVNTPNKFGKTPLYTAIYEGYTDAMLLLLGAGADPNIMTLSGNAPMHIAAEHCKPAAIKALVTAGANMNALDSDGHTPLYIARDRGQIPALVTLLDAGADEKTILDTRYEDHLGQNPTDLEIFELLKEHVQKYANSIKPRPAGNRPN